MLYLDQSQLGFDQQGLVRLHVFTTHAGVCVLESIRIGDNLQENVVFVQDVGQICVTSVISHDLHQNKQRNAALQLNASRTRITCQMLLGAKAWWMHAGRWSRKWIRLTFLANQVPLAWVTHSLEWIPVSNQIPGRLAPVLNYTTQDTRFLEVLEVSSSIICTTYLHVTHFQDV